MRRVFYDCEFVDDGRTIDPISIGMVDDQGRTLYAVNADMPVEKVVGHDWLSKNVWPLLPLVDKHVPDADGTRPPQCACKPRHMRLDRTNIHVVPRQVLVNQVRDFLLRPNEPLELWANYAAYDHVMLAQLFGPMVKLPKGVPPRTCCIQQFADEHDAHGMLPPMLGNTHNALDDALWNHEAWKAIDRVKTRRRQGVVPV